MDRGVRNSIARETRRTVAAIRQNAYELSCTLESAKSEEEAKLYNMPEAMKMELRSASESSYVSKNEMVCRALKEYLSGTDYK